MRGDEDRGVSCGLNVSMPLWRNSRRSALRARCPFGRAGANPVGGIIYNGLVGKHADYSRRALEPAVKSSLSVTEVIRKLGLSYSSKRHELVRRKIAELDLDITHFFGRGANRGPDKKGGAPKLAWTEVLVKRPAGSSRQTAHRLRRALIEAGRDYACAECGLRDQWNGRELRLTVDHIDGDPLDCRIHNLRFMCPNCHSQTITWGRNFGGTDLTSAAEQYRRKRRMLAAERNIKVKKTWACRPGDKTPP